VGGLVKCWGSNGYGQLGSGTADSHVPVQTQSLSGGGVRNLVAGGLHTCGIVANRVTCWGRNIEGQLGNNSTTQSSIPVIVSGL